jgi:hypothetical protein
LQRDERRRSAGRGRPSRPPSSVKVIAE